MGADSIALFRLRSRRTDDADDAVVYRGPDYVGVFWAMRFHDVRERPELASAALSQAYPDLFDGHSDPRGVLVFPDAVEVPESTYRELTSDPGLAEVALWLPRLDSTTATVRTAPADETVAALRIRVIPGARNVALREVAPSIAQIALGERRFRPARATQQVFEVSMSLDDVVSFYEGELAAFDVSKQRLELASETVVQLVGRTPSGRVVVKIDSNARGHVSVSITVMTSH